MQNTAISSRNIGCLIALSSISSLLMTGSGKIGQDMWLAVIAATVFAVPLVLMYARIAKLNPGLNLYEMACQNLGNAAGSIITALLSWFALHISALVTQNFTEFVVTISLENTPKVFIIMGMIAVGGFLAGTNFNVMGRWSVIILIIVSGNLFVTLLLSLPSVNFSNLKPVMEHGLPEILSTGFSFGAIAFAETVLALVAFGSAEEKARPYKAYAFGIGYSAVMLLSVVMRNATVLGREMAATTVFPTYVTARIVSPSAFVEHIESIVSLNLILIGITKVSICIRASAMGVAKLLRMADIKKLIVPVSLLSVAVCVASFSNMKELILFVDAYRFYVIPFTIIIPAAIWTGSEWRKRNKKKNGMT
ncbi:MAG: endospore germination permease [Oscillospiraceae bacterium]|jgi:spore germination protein KB|nr:endospore germination permease [Oscillospiraceae bacterium]